MNKIQKLKGCYKTINNRKCKISKYNNGMYSVEIKGEERDRDINIVYYNNIIRLDQVTDKNSNEFYAIDVIENNGKEFFSYSNDIKVGDLKEMKELINEKNIIQNDVNFLKNIKTEIDEMEKLDNIKYQFKNI